jgi:hypothetical protein
MPLSTIFQLKVELNTIKPIIIFTKNKSENDFDVIYQ